VALAQIGLVAPVQGVQVTVDGQLAVYHRILGRQVGLVEIVRVVHVRAPQAPIDHQRGAWADQHRDGAGATCRTRVALGVDSDVGRDHHGQPAVPRARLDPRQSVEQRGRAAITGVRRIDSLHLEIAAGLKQLHQHRFRAFRLVDYGLGAHLQATNVRVADAVVFDELTDRRQAQRVYVFQVRAEPHLLLTQADGIFPSGHLVVSFQIGLIDVQRWYYDVNGTYSNIFWPVVHDELQ